MKNVSCFGLLAFALMVAGCGFSPIYGRHENSPLVDRSLSSVKIANIPDRDGQKLRNHLIDRMYYAGKPIDPKAELAVVLRSTESDLGIQKDATTARRQLNMWADYELHSTKGQSLLKGTAHSVVSFNKLDAQYGTLAAQKNAEDRAIHEIGEQIVNRLSLYYAENHIR